MKRHLTTMTLLALLLAAAGTLKGQKYQPYKSGVINYHGYAYPITPGSDEWKKLGYQQRIASLQLPIDTLSTITTNRLLETCLYYVFNSNAIATDNRLLGFENVRSQFNGYNELYKRMDFAQCLLDLYSDREVAFVNQITNDYEKGRYSFDYQIMEYMFADVALIATETQLHQMVVMLVQKTDQRKLYSSIYSSVCLPFVALVIGRCLNRLDALSDYSGTTLSDFLQNGIVADEGDVQYLFEKARLLLDND